MNSNENRQTEQPDQFGLIYTERPFKCRDCGHRVMLGTNHTGECYPQCRGNCRQVTQHWGREVVLPKQTAHVYDVETAGKTDDQD